MGAWEYNLLSSWVEALPFVVFSYNKMHIPGTRVSPFMLRTGKQPMLPEDLQSVEGSCQNETFQSRLDDLRSRIEVCREVVAEAHKAEKERQKVLYDKDKYDVEFEVGSNQQNQHRCDRCARTHRKILPAGESTTAP